MIATLIDNLGNVFTGLADLVKTVIGDNGVSGVVSQLSSNVFGA